MTVSSLILIWVIPSVAPGAPAVLPKQRPIMDDYIYRFHARVRHNYNLNSRPADKLSTGTERDQYSDNTEVTCYIMMNQQPWLQDLPVRPHRSIHSNENVTQYNRRIIFNYGNLLGQSLPPLRHNTFQQ
jgi:hypothetical protein